MMKSHAFVYQVSSTGSFCKDETYTMQYIVLKLSM